VGVAPAARIGCGGLARPDADRLRGHPRGDHGGVGAGPAPARAPGLGGGALRGLRDRRGGGAGALAVGAVSGELPADRPARGGGDRRRRRKLRAARARVRVPEPGRT
jgi:hypothetical protein